MWRAIREATDDLLVGVGVLNGFGRAGMVWYGLSSSGAGASAPRPTRDRRGPFCTLNTYESGLRRPGARRVSPGCMIRDRVHSDRSVVCAWPGVSRVGLTTLKRSTEPVS